MIPVNIPTTINNIKYKIEYNKFKYFLIINLNISFSFSIKKE